MINKEDLRECPYEELDCPYWDWKYQKCTLYAESGFEPSEACDG